MNSVFRLFLFQLAGSVVLGLECQEFVIRMLQKNYIGDIREQSFLDYSAKDDSVETDLGDSDSCNSNPLMKYFLALRTLRSTTGAISELRRGVCLPKECEDPQNLNNQSLIVNIFQARGWNYNNEDTFELYDPKAPTTKSIFFYITVALIAGILLINIYSTVSISLSKKNGKDKNLLDEPGQVNNWFMESFNMKANFMNMYQTAGEQKLNEHISIFNFLRALTAYWVLYMHSYSIQLILLNNTNVERYWWNSFQGSICVEPFFIMTGFLGAYVLVPKLNKKEKFDIQAYLDIIKHRFFRVWPPLIVGLLLYWQISPYVSTGPLMYKSQKESANNYPWYVALLVSNLYYSVNNNTSGYYVVSWYISCEFQMYLVLVLAIAVYIRYKKVGYGVVIFFIIQSLAMGIITCIVYKIDYVSLHNRRSNPDFAIYFSYIPYERWYPLFIGALMGLLYYEYAKLNQPNIFNILERNPMVSYISMTIGVGLFWITFFPPFSVEEEPLSLIWFPVRIFLLDISIIMFFMPLVSNRQSYLKRFFNLRIFQILGKASYFFYLVHFCFMADILNNNPSLLSEVSFLTLMKFVAINLVCTQFLSILLHVLVEIPVKKIEQHFEAEKTKKFGLIIKPNSEEEGDRLLLDNESEHRKKWQE